MIIVLAGLVAVGAAAYFLLRGQFQQGGGASSSENSSSVVLSSEQGETVSGDSSFSYYAEECDPISFHFIDREEQYSGDALYIKVGEKDILIDAGARQKSADAIANYLEDSARADHVSDQKLEYVVATHAHRDHLMGFYGSSKAKGIFYRYSVDNLIDFSYVDAEDGKSIINNADPTNSANDSRFVDYSATYTKGSGSSVTESNYSSGVYQNYVKARETLLGNGTNWKTAGELCNANSGYTYTIEIGKGVSMTLLYNFFYDHTSNEVKSLESNYVASGFSEQNDYSVCLLFAQGTRRFLFTGDAESYAEHSLVKFNGLPKVDLFKAGHHGSFTASSKELLDVVDPSLCVVTCCAGNQEFARGESNKPHTFPAQEFIDRIAPHTDRVYVTTLGSFDDINHFEPFNGNIVVSYSAFGEETLSFSNNSKKLKESDWMKENRTMPSSWA